jgi:hypothetical protein
MNLERTVGALDFGRAKKSAQLWRGAGECSGTDARRGSDGSLERRQTLLALPDDGRAVLRRRAMQRPNRADGAGRFVVLILMLSALLFSMRTQAPLFARLGERSKRDRTLQREQRREGEAAAPPVWAAKRAR